jgi:LacI family gluconate utilization system Gnt-I transcriptional repressor
VNVATRTVPNVKLVDVAAAAGVGESTASRVLRSHGSYSKQTQDRVLAAVAQLGYVPNRIAGSLASTGSSLVAMVIPSLSNSVFADVLHGVGSALEAVHQQAVFAVTDYVAEREEAMVAAMLAWRPSAVMLAGLEHTGATIAMLRARGCRVVELLDIDGAAIDMAVGYSNIEAGRASARHLIGRGYRTIGYVGHDLDHDTRATKRLAGFREVLRESGVSLADQELVAAPSSVAAGVRALGEMLVRTPDLDAVYFSNDDMAIGGYFHCLAHGVSVPGDMALFGFNGIDIAAAAPQPLSTIRTPRAEIGSVAASLVLAQAKPQIVDVGFELVAGATA